MPRDDERIPIVDLVRFVSILLVFSIHLDGSRVAVAPQSEWMASVASRVVRNGVYGVSLFFVVSGYVITRSIVRRHADLATIDLRGFYVRRAGRILPPLVLAVVSGLLVTHFFGGAGGRTAYCLHHPRAVFDAAFWIALATFCFNWLRIARQHTTPTFGLQWDVLWSLAIEEQFYMTYPFVLRALKSRARVMLFLMIVVVSGPIARVVSNMIDEESFLVTFTNSFVCFDLLAMGCLLFFVLDRLPPPKRPSLEPLLGLGALAVLVLVYLFTFLGDPDDRVWAPSVIGLSLAVFMGVGIRRRWLNGKLARAVVYPGQLSYGAYLFHPLVLFVGWWVLRRQPIGVAFVLFATMVLAIAYLLYIFYERPTNRAIRSVRKT